MAVNASYLMRRFWDYAIERGEKPRPVWAVISTGGQQPIGYIISWSVSKRAAERRMAALEYAGQWRLARVEYRA